MAKLFFPFPQLATQRRIAAYLDRETARIDALVAEKESLLCLLEEKRASLISHAVTKGLPGVASAKTGLNPKAKLKPSGIRSDLDDYGIHTPAAIDAFCEVFYSKGNKEKKIEKMHALTNPVVDLYKQMDETDRKNYKSQMRDYVKLYGFLSQLVIFKDARLERLYAFAGFVVKKLPALNKPLPTEVLNMTDLDNYKPSLIGTKKIDLKRGETAVKPKNYGGTSVAEPEFAEPLSKIIDELNNQFGTKFTEEDRVMIEHIEQKLGQDVQLQQQLAAGSKQAARMSFEEVAQDLIHDLIDSNFKFHKKVQDDQEISKELFDRLFERYYAKKGH